MLFVRTKLKWRGTVPTALLLTACLLSLSVSAEGENTRMPTRSQIGHQKPTFKTTTGAGEGRSRRNAAPTDMITNATTIPLIVKNTPTTTIFISTSMTTTKTETSPTTTSGNKTNSVTLTTDAGISSKTTTTRTPTTSTITSSSTTICNTETPTTTNNSAITSRSTSTTDKLSTFESTSTTDKPYITTSTSTTDKPTTSTSTSTTDKPSTFESTSSTGKPTTSTSTTTTDTFTIPIIAFTRLTKTDALTTSTTTFTSTKSTNTPTISTTSTSTITTTSNKLKTHAISFTSFTTTNTLTTLTNKAIFTSTTSIRPSTSSTAAIDLKTSTFIATKTKEIPMYSSAGSIEVIFQSKAKSTTPFLNIIQSLRSQAQRRMSSIQARITSTMSPVTSIFKTWQLLYIYIIGGATLGLTLLAVCIGGFIFAIWCIRRCRRARRHRLVRVRTYLFDVPSYHSRQPSTMSNAYSATYEDTRRSSLCRTKVGRVPLNTSVENISTYPESEKANAGAEGSDRREQFIGNSQWQNTSIREENSIVTDIMAINYPVRTNAREESEGPVYSEQPYFGYGPEPLCPGSDTHRQSFHGIQGAPDSRSNDVRQAKDHVGQTLEDEDSENNDSENDDW